MPPSIGGIMNFIFLAAPMFEKVRESAGSPEQAEAIAAAIGRTVGPCFGLIYPVVLLVFMLRPSFTKAISSKDHGGELRA